MDSKSARNIALLFLFLAVVGAVICGSILTTAMAVAIAVSFVSLAVVFLILEGILKNQETLISLAKEQNEKLALIASKMKE